MATIGQIARLYWDCLRLKWEWVKGGENIMNLDWSVFVPMAISALCRFLPAIGIPQNVADAFQAFALVLAGWLIAKSNGTIKATLRKAGLIK